MAPADDLDGVAKASPLWGKYGERVESESAREVLAERVERATVPTQPVPAPKRRRKAKAPRGDQIGDFLSSRQGRQLEREVMRGVFGMLRKRL